MLGKPKESEDRQTLVKMLKYLSICHTIVIDSATGKYSAASPDELALVCFSKSVGYEFKGKDEDDNYEVETPDEGQLSFKLLHECTFSSARKRMSVII